MPTRKLDAVSGFRAQSWHGPTEVWLPKVWVQNPKINNGYTYLIANPPSK